MGSGTNSAVVYQSWTVTVVVMMHWKNEILKLWRLFSHNSEFHKIFPSKFIHLYSFSFSWQRQQVEKVSPNYSISCQRLQLRLVDSQTFPSQLSDTIGSWGLHSTVSIQWDVLGTALMGTKKGHPCKVPKAPQLGPHYMEDCQALHHTIRNIPSNPMNTVSTTGNCLIHLVKLPLSSLRQVSGQD